VYDQKHFFALENALYIDSDHTIGIIEFHPQLIRPPPTVNSPNGEIVGLADGPPARQVDLRVPGPRLCSRRCAIEVHALLTVPPTHLFLPGSRKRGHGCAPDRRANRLGSEGSKIRWDTSLYQKCNPRRDQEQVIGLQELFVLDRSVMAITGTSAFLRRKTDPDQNATEPACLETRYEQEI
jgi:hypothetical protein